MGVFSCCIAFLKSIDISDWISIIGIIVNALITLYIVDSVQRKLNNNRILTDHFIAEIKILRDDYRLFFKELEANTIQTSKILTWFKSMSIKTNDLLEIIHSKNSRIDKDVFLTYNNELRDLITDHPDYTKSFQSNKILVVSECLGIKLLQFKQQRDNIFNKTIVIINDAN